MQRVKYRTIPTTADIGIEVWGSGLPELFSHAAQAVLDIMADTKGVDKAITLEVEAKGRDVEGLLVAWLNEIIFLHEAKEMVFAEAQVVELTALAVKGRLYGEAIDLGRHELRRLIKGVTYHKLCISQVGEQEWRLQAILDI